MRPARPLSTARRQMGFSTKRSPRTPNLLFTGGPRVSNSGRPGRGGSNPPIQALPACLQMLQSTHRAISTTPNARQRSDLSYDPEAVVIRLVPDDDAVADLDAVDRQEVDARTGGRDSERFPCARHRSCEAVRDKDGVAIGCRAHWPDLASDIGEGLERCDQEGSYLLLPMECLVERWFVPHNVRCTELDERRNVVRLPGGLPASGKLCGVPLHYESPWTAPLAHATMASTHAAMKRSGPTSAVGRPNVSWSI